MFSKRSLAEAYHANFEYVIHVEKLTSKRGPLLDWNFADPSRLVQLTLSRCTKLQLVYERALQKHPCSSERPWKLIVGFDEFVPGNKLKLDNSKKVMNLVFNFQELGSHLYC